MKRSLCSQFLLFTLLFLSAINGFAQEKITVKGKVTSSADNEGLIGVSVSLKGTSTGAMTDPDGNYSLSVPANGILVFNYVGYETQEVNVDNRTTINIVLVQVSKALEEVIVIGYGTQRKIDITGSTGSIKGAELTKQPVLTATQAAQGKLAGVQIISSGAPGTQPVVRIRGTGTMLAGADPLYVVDGVITSDIRNINSADIVSMDILKDASSTAIYGMRAANGVVLITTKKGSVGKDLRVTYDGNVGFRQVANLVTMASGPQYATYIGDINAGLPPNEQIALPGNQASTEWYDEILRKGFQQNHNISVSGGSEKVNYFFSGSYLTDEGIVLENKYERFTLRSNTDFILSSKVKLGNQLSFSTGQTRDVNLTGAYNDSYRAAPIIESKVDGKYGNTSAFGNVGNPILDIENNDNKLTENRVQGNLYLEYSPITSLQVRSAFGGDFFNNKRRIYQYQFFNTEATFITAGGNQRNDRSLLEIRNDNTFRWVWDNTVTYNHKFDNATLKVLGGVTTEKYTNDNNYGSKKDIPSTKDQWYLSNTGDPETAINDGGGEKWSRTSFIGRVNYDLMNRYLFTATFRADGTSRFPSANRWGFFPSFGFGWILSEENFLKKQTTFDLLKLRASWGRVGNDQVPPNSATSIADTGIPYFFATQPVRGTAITQIVDENLKWEITEEYDIGLDFSAIQGQLSGTIDYYNKKTKDALVRVNLPAILGDADGVYLTNAASFVNRGWEFTINWSHRSNENFKYNIGFNATFNHNEIVGLNQGQALVAGTVGQQSFTTKSDNGQPIGSFFVLQTDGIFQSQAEIDASAQKSAKVGDLRYKDFSGDGQINDDDRVYVGSYQPKMYFGLTGGFTYKDFDFSIDCYGNFGNQIYNGKKGARVNATDNIESDVANSYWRSDRTNTGVPRASRDILPASTYFVESGDFFRINNITLGYTLPKKTLERIKIETLRFYISSQNLLTLKAYSGFTPELVNPASVAATTQTPNADATLAPGIELNAYPTTRTFTFGVNLTF
ncbi:SusC/RagA family TonB-linked outer membrane protein [Solitalea canadensis]|uniref:TonB-linked outer membrane protein, SusC/RagA family n=1 Tax=Solitalea canadensis (strain ATCC 29591 / DSM 3403 / JCM 21819 / LMG 8368 / NBRC 15130 / NCIMB 12057 / USAM 9D) TaxID=929556 RepID=H8KQL1_SOLCM|nr:TonB-dependent receptor [Solitalea canadensis]AFD06749.1 TonB-linked outer membrane protein, SusC/RagA family [Solitalea canadensis DSM 3403]